MFSQKIESEQSHEFYTTAYYDLFVHFIRLMIEISAHTVNLCSNAVYLMNVSYNLNPPSPKCKSRTT